MQLSFDFPFQDRYLSEDFIVSSCNQEAFDFVINYSPDDPNVPNIFAIRADQFSGKTYLAHIWSRRFEAEFLELSDLKNVNPAKLIEANNFYIIENIDEVKNQELLLQIFNLAQEKLAFLLITSNVDLKQIGCEIKDLNSRLKNVVTLTIDNPDDLMIEMLLTKNFFIKQLQVEKKVINFLVKNINRSFASIHNTIKLLEFFSLERKRNITIALAKKVL